MLIEGQWPEWDALAVYTWWRSRGAVRGYWWFQKTRKGFADVV